VANRQSTTTTLITVIIGQRSIASDRSTVYWAWRFTTDNAHLCISYLL